MRKAYNVLGWVIAGLVMLQAAALAWGVGGENHFIENGGVVDKALVESAQSGGEPPFPEVVGYMIHGINGGMLIPALSLILLVVSFKAGLPHARRNAAILFVLVFIQINLGYSISGVPFLGFLHGLNALLVFGTALLIARHTAPIPEAAAAGTDTAMTSATH